MRENRDRDRDFASTGSVALEAPTEGQTKGATQGVLCIAVVARRRPAVPEPRFRSAVEQVFNLELQTEAVMATTRPLFLRPRRIDHGADTHTSREKARHSKVVGTIASKVAADAHGTSPVQDGVDAPSRVPPSSR